MMSYRTNVCNFVAGKVKRASNKPRRTILQTIPPYRVGVAQASSGMPDAAARPPPRCRHTAMCALALRLITSGTRHLLGDSSPRGLITSGTRPRGDKARFLFSFGKVFGERRGRGGIFISSLFIAQCGVGRSQAEVGSMRTHVSKSMPQTTANAAPWPRCANRSLSQGGRATPRAQSARVSSARAPEVSVHVFVPRCKSLFQVNHQLSPSRHGMSGATRPARPCSCR
mmetsp:Transcript_39131/g.84225  ORF Transcript_39131/g.84225 Transcript_39131/m.84225 type:complete len:227 (+) Transcript_39131:606-1286(+)